jgi:acetyl-CoA acyltransferase 1
MSPPFRLLILTYRSFACASHAKAKAAQDAGYFAEEIVPMKVRSVTPADGDKTEVIGEKIISVDEGIRPQTTLASLAKLKPAFRGDGTGTAGNSSQISDGASAMTLVRRDVAEALGLKPIAKWVGSAVVGVPPKIMGAFSFVRAWMGGSLTCAMDRCRTRFRCSRALQTLRDH